MPTPNPRTRLAELLLTPDGLLVLEETLQKHIDDHLTALLDMRRYVQKIKQGSGE